MIFPKHVCKHVSMNQIRKKCPGYLPKHCLWGNETTFRFWIDGTIHHMVSLKKDCDYRLTQQISKFSLVVLTEKKSTEGGGGGCVSWLPHLLASHTHLLQVTFNPWWGEGAHGVSSVWLVFEYFATLSLPPGLSPVDTQAAIEKSLKASMYSNLYSLTQPHSNHF